MSVKLKQRNGQRPRNSLKSEVVNTLNLYKLFAAFDFNRKPLKIMIGQYTTITGFAE